MGVIIATHGKLCEGLIDSVELITGTTGDISKFSMTKDKSETEARKEIDALLEKYKEDSKLVVFTDIMGGSVCNIFTEKLINQGGFELIAGVNLPMILSYIVQDSNKIESCVSDGLEGIVHVNEKLFGEETD